MKKINVIGTTASGKSTFSKKLSARLNIPYISMDKLFWKSNWTESTNEELFQKLEEALNQDTWVLDGNFSRTNDIKWKDVDTIIWIDFSFLRTLYQSISRALSRIICQKELWEGTGNKETLSRLFSKDSIVLWLFKQYGKKKRTYSKLITEDKYNHINFVRLQSPKECEKYLKQLESS